MKAEGGISAENETDPDRSRSPVPIHPSAFLLQPSAEALSLSCHPLAAAICTEALSWLGTKFVDQACVKHGGVDCANLLVGVATALHLIPQTWRPPPYHPGHHCHLADERLLATILALGGHALVPAARQPGDIVLFRLRGARSHGHAAILLPDCRIVHAVLGRGVITHGLSGMWARTATAAARFPIGEGD